MNSYLIKRLALGLALLAIIFVTGCGDMDDIQEEFIKRGETTYTAKPDSLKIFGGINKIKLVWFITSDPKITKYKVYWNNRRDSLVNNITRTKGVDTVEIMLTELPEGTYHFEIFTYDKMGNSSVKSTIIGKAYGDLYANTLLTRTPRKIRRVSNSLLEIGWMAADEELAFVDIEYTDKDGEVKQVRAPKAEEYTVLNNFPAGGSFKYTSAFLPEPKALDTFYTDVTTVTRPSTKVNWNDYNVIFGNHNNLVARQQADGAIMQFDYKIEDYYKLPRRVGSGWGGFASLHSYNGNLIAYLTTGGVVRRYPLSAAGGFGTMTQIGSKITANELFKFGNFIVARNAAGNLTKYPVNANGTLGGASSITGTWNIYNELLASGDFIIGRTSDGKLWRIPVDSNASAAGTPVEIGRNWDRFNLISNHGDDLLARETNGKLWRYKLDGNGTLSAPEEVPDVIELVD